MMISDGNGMHADSMAIKRATPAYPEVEIVAIMKEARTASIISVIPVEYTCLHPNLYDTPSQPVRAGSGQAHSHHRSQPLRRQTGLRRRLPLRCIRHAAPHRIGPRHVRRAAA